MKEEIEKNTKDKKNMSELFDIPIIIDSVKDYDDFKMTRCSYYTVESSVPIPNWNLELQKRNVPVHLDGVTGIVFKPLGENKTFESRELIDGLFDAIEQDPFYIDSDYIWLPNSLLQNQDRGQVYRIRSDLFNIASKFKDNKITMEEFNSKCKSYMDSITPSELETKSFQDWEKNQIDGLIKLYHKDPDIHLKYRGKEE